MTTKEECAARLRAMQDLVFRLSNEELEPDEKVAFDCFKYEADALVNGFEAALDLAPTGDVRPTEGAMVAATTSANDVNAALLQMDFKGLSMTEAQESVVRNIANRAFTLSGELAKAQRRN